MLMCISLFTPCVFSECFSAGMKGPITSNNSMQQTDNGNHSSGSAHLFFFFHGGILFSRLFIYFFIYFYQLEANYFTILQWFLPYIDMNQPCIYMCSPSRSPSRLPPHPTPLGLPSAPALSTCRKVLGACTIFTL